MFSSSFFATSANRREPHIDYVVDLHCRNNTLACTDWNRMLTYWNRMLAGSGKHWCISLRLLHIPVVMVRKMLRCFFRTGECREVSKVGKQQRNVSNLGFRWLFCRHIACCSGGSGGFDDATRRGSDFKSSSCSSSAKCHFFAASANKQTNKQTNKQQRRRHSGCNKWHVTTIK